MSDTFTDSLGYLLQETGGNDNTWGQNINDQVTQYVEDKFVGRTAKSTTGGATALTQAECRKAFLDISGTLSGDATFTVPTKKNRWIVTNSCAGDFAVLFTTSGGTATSIPAGCSIDVYCDGTDVFRTDRHQVGEMFYSANATVPNGAYECTGAAISRTGRGIDLFAKTSTTWGVGNGSSTFNIPDGYTAGRFLRSRTASVSIGSSQTDQNKAHTHTGTTGGTTATGSIDLQGTHNHGGATSTDGTHNHTVTVEGHSGGGGGSSPYAAAGTSSVDVTQTPTTSSAGSHSHSISSSGLHNHTFTGNSHTHTFTTDSDGGTEARPTNLSAILCVRY